MEALGLDSAAVQQIVTNGTCSLALQARCPLAMQSALLAQQLGSVTHQPQQNRASWTECSCTVSVVLTVLKQACI